MQQRSNIVDAQREIERLLKEHHAVLARDGKHLVYKLPNGHTVVLPRTPSDYRAARNTLSDLRRALGIVRAAPEEKGIIMPIVDHPAPPQAPATPPDEPKPQALKDRLDAAIVAEEARQEKLMAEAQQVERRVQMLKALVPYVEDPKAEATLRGILPAPEPPPPEPPRAAPPPPPPPPPQVVTDRVQVTRQLVLAATQTFEDTFTVNDVLDLMTNGRYIAGPERFRIRSSIAQAMVGLCERGELVRVEEGIGKRQTIWQKAVLDGSKAVGRRA